MRDPLEASPRYAEQVDLRDRWAAVVGREGDDLRLDEAALIIAAHIEPATDIDAELERLDALAAGCERGDLDGLSDLLFARLGLRGDKRTYDDPRNSSLPSVLDRRVGIPISLSVLMIEVGRRVGVPLVGVGMPGHFLVGQLESEARPVLVDAFGAGRRLDVSDCRAIFATVGGPPRAWSDELLSPTPPPAIVARMLANLTASYSRRGDLAGRRWVAELGAALSEGSPNQRLLVASELAQTGAFGASANIIEATADRMVESSSDDAARLRAQARQVRARLN